MITSYIISLSVESFPLRVSDVSRPPTLMPSSSAWLSVVGASECVRRIIYIYSIDTALDSRTDCRTILCTTNFDDVVSYTCSLNGTHILYAYFFLHSNCLLGKKDRSRGAHRHEIPTAVSTFLGINNLNRHRPTSTDTGNARRSLANRKWKYLRPKGT